jgi:hypothetical protein
MVASSSLKKMTSRFEPNSSLRRSWRLVLVKWARAVRGVKGLSMNGPARIAGPPLTPLPARPGSRWSSMRTSPLDLDGIRV